MINKARDYMTCDINISINSISNQNGDKLEDNAISMWLGVKAHADINTKRNKRSSILSENLKMNGYAMTRMSTTPSFESVNKDHAIALFLKFNHFVGLIWQIIETKNSNNLLSVWPKNDLVECNGNVVFP
ncbi:hypothetical protein CHS0354_019616 [Potamilus streckersoni]|uniref:Uncharacterized protein n=1 Tax=Potamilus streckersoni TaxID=2493646 RepID=A0AAE0T8X3_9BIVA|nr:hypothetical protein CHS0354_019616 [Potamilus streckersoni]